MGDFLKKFTDTSYQDMKPTEDAEELQTDTVVADDTLMDTQTTLETSNTKEEVYVYDDEKIKKRKKLILIGVLSTVLLICLGLFGYHKFNEVRVPQFVKDKTLNDVQIWASKNKLDMEYTTVFSTTVDNGYVVKQSEKSGATIQKGSHITFVLSKGANPEERITVPDLMKMNLTEIEDWKRKKKLPNVSIEKVFHDEVEKAKTIRFEYKSEGIDASNYRRKDKLNIIVSKGKEEYEKDIDMPDFKNKSKGEVESWAKENDVSIVFEEVADSKVMEGNVIAQDIQAKTKIAKKDTVKITISRGKISYVPNFGGLDETQGQIAAIKANVGVNIIYYYHNDVPANFLISQSIPAGTEIKEQIIALMYSLGKPYIGNFDGQDVYMMVQSIGEMNGKGARLTYEIVEVGSTETKGKILTSNYKGGFVNVGTHIVISISTGS